MIHLDQRNCLGGLAHSYNGNACVCVGKVSAFFSCLICSPYVISWATAASSSSCLNFISINRRKMQVSEKGSDPILISRVGLIT